MKKYAFSCVCMITACLLTIGIPYVIGAIIRIAQGLSIYWRFEIELQQILTFTTYSMIFTLIGWALFVVPVIRFEKYLTFLFHKKFSLFWGGMLGGFLALLIEELLLNYNWNVFALHSIGGLAPFFVFYGTIIGSIALFLYSNKDLWFKRMCPISEDFY